MTLYILALLVGIVAGLRNMTAAAAVSWAAYLGWLPLQGTPLAFLGAQITPYIFTVLAIAELFADQWSKTPSRKAPPSFVIRLVAGAMSGAAIGATGGALAAGAALGAIGAIIGTLGGYAARIRLATALGKDLPAALIEDVITIVAAALIVMAAR
jgi:uncharacterized membrane protein